MQNGGGCNDFPGCSGNCPYDRGCSHNGTERGCSNYPDVSCHGFSGNNTRYSTN